VFRCKQFEVAHDKCAMKVGTDSLLLGSWAQPNDAKLILDIGTGSGILALMMAQKSTLDAHVYAVDVDDGAIIQASENVSASPWRNKVTTVHCALDDFDCDNPLDLIITNPPYFDAVDMTSSAFVRQTTQRSVARHEALLTTHALFTFSAKHLKSNGALYCVYPYNRAPSILEEAKRCGLHASRLMTVKHARTSSPYLMAFCFSKKECDLNKEVLIIRDGNGDYTAGYKTLCRDFYLRF
jgi:tRNA1Val (adenine37-N6)-methyltransferase